MVVKKGGKTDVLNLKRYLTRLRNKKMAQQTRKNERIQEELKKRKLAMCAKYFKINDVEGFFERYNSSADDSAETLRKFIEAH